MRLGAARRGISRVGVAGGVGGRAPNSLLAGFPQLHVRLRSRRAERRARNTALRWSCCLAAPRAGKPQSRKLLAAAASPRQALLVPYSTLANRQTEPIPLQDTLKES